MNHNVHNCHNLYVASALTAPNFYWPIRWIRMKKTFSLAQLRFRFAHTLFVQSKRNPWMCWFETDIWCKCSWWQLHHACCKHCRLSEAVGRILHSACLCLLSTPLGITPDVGGPRLVTIGFHQQKQPVGTCLCFTISNQGQTVWFNPWLWLFCKRNWF